MSGPFISRWTLNFSSSIGSLDPLFSSQIKLMLLGSSEVYAESNSVYLLSSFLTQYLFRYPRPKSLDHLICFSRRCLFVMLYSVSEFDKIEYTLVSDFLMLCRSVGVLLPVAYTESPTFSLFISMECMLVWTSACTNRGST